MSLAELHAALDDWLDRRFEDATPAAELVERFAREGLGVTAIETLLRAGRAAYPPLRFRPGELSGPFALASDHVDHATGLLLYVPGGYVPTRAWPLVLVGHGGSAARDLRFGEAAARAGLEPDWVAAAEREGFLLAAPLTDRGWGAIGLSLLFSTLARVTRGLHVDPDRVYVTGHSMGGHLAWRCALNFPDRFAAVGPMSGGYDFAADGSAALLANCPGFATWGTREPYGIGEANRANRAWLEAHGADWEFAECEGGHEIFPGTVARMAAFFAARERDLYRAEVVARAGGPLAYAEAETHPDWGCTHVWRPQRPLSTASVHWLRLAPLPAGTPPERAVQQVRARRVGPNALALECRDAERVRLGLHPWLVDLAAPVRVTVNGREVFHARVTPDPAALLECVRAADDRGRIFHAFLDLEVPEPLRRGAPPA